MKTQADSVSEGAGSYAAFQQQRGRLPDLIEEAINIYDGFMKDDDYDQQRCLNRVIEKLKSARDWYDSPSPTSMASSSEGAERHPLSPFTDAEWAKCVIRDDVAPTVHSRWNFGTRRYETPTDIRRPAPISSEALHAVVDEHLRINGILPCASIEEAARELLDTAVKSEEYWKIEAHRLQGEKAMAENRLTKLTDAFRGYALRISDHAAACEDQFPPLADYLEWVSGVISAYLRTEQRQSDAALTRSTSEVERERDEAQRLYSTAHGLAIDNEARALAAEAEVRRLREALQSILDVDDGAELNMLNYNHDGVERLNDAFVKTAVIAKIALLPQREAQGGEK